MIKNLIFDFGKVLVDYDFERFFRLHIPDTDRCNAFIPILYNERVQRLLDREEQPFDVIMQQIIDDNPDFAPEIRMFIDHYPEIVLGEMPGMFALLSQLKSEGFRLYRLTNPCSKASLTMQQLPVFTHLDRAVTSSEEKVIKPEPDIYRILLSRFGLKPHESLFTDDRPENIEGGRAVGIDGIVFHDAHQYEAELRSLLRRSI